MKSRVFLTFAFALLAWSAQADNYADNHRWKMTCSEAGYELKSSYPVARVTGEGIGAEMNEGIETLNLAKTCEATHNILGKGKWCWSNGGFKADFAAEQSVAFWRQELTCEGTSDDFIGCRCE